MEQGLIQVAEPTTRVFEVDDGRIIHPEESMMNGIIGKTLITHYPGYAWYVDVNVGQGLAWIACHSVSGTHGIPIKLSGNFSISNFEHLAVMAGGEILERFNVRRGQADEVQLAELPQDACGRPVIPT